MSTNTETSKSDSYPRENFWGEDLDDGQDEQDGFEEHRDAGSAHDVLDGTSKTEWLAHRILKHSGTIICARTLRDEPFVPRTAQLFALLDGEPVESDPTALHLTNCERELSDPAVRLPEQASDQSRGTTGTANGRHRSRVNERSGYISGEGTGAIIQDRPAGEFMDVVEDVLARAAFDLGARATERRALREQARRMKRSGEHRDVDIMETILDKLLHPNRDADTDN